MGWFGVVRGHPSLLAMSPFDRAHTTSYSSLIETIRLSCTVYEIQPSIGPKSLYFDTLLRLTPRRRGSPGTISVKFCTEVRGWPAYTAVKKFCRKVQPLEYGAPTLQTDDRQTTDRLNCDSKDPNVT